MSLPCFFRIELKTIKRGKNGHSTAKAAYIGAEKILDLRTGRVYDFRNRQATVFRTEMLFAEGVTQPLSPQEFWNLVEHCERHPRAWVSREFVLSLPHELPEGRGWALAQGFVNDVIQKYGVAAQLALHRVGKEDARNIHAHAQITARPYSDKGFGERLREWDCRNTSGPIVEELRKSWADHVNKALKEAGIPKTVDHRSYIRQNIDRKPGKPRGKKVHALHRKRATLMRELVKGVSGDWIERLTKVVLESDAGDTSGQPHIPTEFASVIRVMELAMTIDDQCWDALEKRVGYLEKRKTALSANDGHVLLAFEELKTALEIRQATKKPSLKTHEMEDLLAKIHLLHRSGSNKTQKDVIDGFLGRGVGTNRVSDYIDFDERTLMPRLKSWVLQEAKTNESVASTLEEIQKTLEQYAELNRSPGSLALSRSC